MGEEGREGEGEDAGDSLPQQSELFPGALTALCLPGSLQSSPQAGTQRLCLLHCIPGICLKHLIKTLSVCVSLSSGSYFYLFFMLMPTKEA